MVVGSCGHLVTRAAAAGLPPWPCPNEQCVARGSRHRQARVLRLTGIDDTAPAEAIEGGPLDAPIADAKLHKMERGDFAPEFPLEWALKDVDLAIGAAGDGELPLLAALSRQWRAAVDVGHGRDDVSAARLALGGPAQPSRRLTARHEHGLRPARGAGRERDDRGYRPAPSRSRR